MVLGSRSDVPDLLKTFDLYVLTSHWEGLGRSLTEAMYTGRPVVATNVEGVPELVRNGETGMLVEPRNIQAIADAIVQVLQDPELAARLGRAGRQKITESFQYEKMVKEIEFVYDELMRLKGPNV
jgi:glycosyltransferase involved in cell wall biosynthesis